MQNLESNDIGFLQTDNDDLKELQQKNFETAEWNEREQLITLIENGNYALAIQLNNGLKIFGNIQIVSLTKCPFKQQIWELYELLGMLDISLGTYNEYVKLNDCKNESDLLQFICENDCKNFNIYPQKHFLVQSISNYDLVVSIEIKKMKFYTSTNLSKVKWNIQCMFDMFAKLEKILNVIIEKIPENDELPF